MNKREKREKLSFFVPPAGSNIFPTPFLEGGIFLRLCKMTCPSFWGTRRKKKNAESGIKYMRKSSESNAVFIRARIFGLLNICRLACLWFGILASRRYLNIFFGLKVGRYRGKVKRKKRTHPSCPAEQIPGHETVPIIGFGPGTVAKN
jgi:hypothetical protein